MPTTVDCPSCSRRLRVTDELLGTNVKCPTCGEVFTADLNGSAPPPSDPPQEERRPLVKSRRPARDEDDDDDDRPSRRRKRRRYMQPHRGQMIMILGILSFFIAGIVLGPIAWIMGNNDLKEMRAGRMDPEGESNTNVGRICGMISTILHIVGLVVGCLIVIVYFVIVALIIGAAASSAPPGPGPGPASPPPQKRPFNLVHPLRLADYLPRPQALSRLPAVALR
jgi:predicted Zn finger-like uncharacterized protein